MFRLQELCLDVIGDIAESLPEFYFRGLPRPVLCSVTKYLSAFDLHRLHMVFADNDIDTNAEWMALLNHRWKRWAKRSSSVFRDEFLQRRVTDLRRVYLELHCRELLWHDINGACSDVLPSTTECKVGLNPCRRIRERLNTTPAVKCALSRSSLMHTDVNADAADAHQLEPKPKAQCIQQVNKDQSHETTCDKDQSHESTCSQHSTNDTVNSEHVDSLDSNECVTSADIGECTSSRQADEQLPRANSYHDNLFNYLDLIDSLMIVARPIILETVLRRSDLLNVLKRNVRQLVIYGLKSHAYDLTRRLIRELTCDGHVCEIQLLYGHLHRSELANLLTFDDLSHQVSVTDDSEGELTLVEQQSGKDCELEETLDLFDEALQPCQQTQLVSTMHGGALMVGHESCAQPYDSDLTGYNSFALLDVKAENEHLLSEVLSVVQKWPHLSKLAISSTYSPLVCPYMFETYLCNIVRSGQLTHLVLSDCLLFSCDFISSLASALLHRNSCKGMVHLELDFPDSGGFEVNEGVLAEIRNHRFHGAEYLKIYWEAYGFTEELVALWIRQDLALKHLILRCVTDENLFFSIVESVRVNGNLETLSLKASLISPEQLQAVIGMLHAVPTLKKLNLQMCELPAEIVDSPRFLECIGQHPNLIKLNIAGNRLEKSSCSVLMAICCSNINKNFEVLDISANNIKAADLLQTASNINAYATNHRCRQLVKLDISGSIFNEFHADIVNQYKQIVQAVVADKPDSAFADYVSQM